MQLSAYMQVLCVLSLLEEVSSSTMGPLSSVLISIWVWRPLSSSNHNDFRVLSLHKELFGSTHHHFNQSSCLILWHLFNHRQDWSGWSTPTHWFQRKPRQMASYTFSAWFCQSVQLLPNFKTSSQLAEFQSVSSDLGGKLETKSNQIRTVAFKYSAVYCDVIFAAVCIKFTNSSCNVGNNIFATMTFSSFWR